MAGGRSERHYEAQDAQVSVDFITDYGQYHTAHYVKGLEIVFLLNGNASILLDGRSLNLVHGEFIVIGSGQVYELGCSEQFMEVRIRVDGEFLATKAALTMKEGQTGWSTRCMREELEREMDREIPDDEPHDVDETLRQWVREYHRETDL